MDVGDLTAGEPLHDTFRKEEKQTNPLFGYFTENQKDFLDTTFPNLFSYICTDLNSEILDFICGILL